MKLAKIIDFIKSHIKINIYRVGDIILTTNDTNPKYDYGGTWELWGAGKVPVGVDLSQTEFNEIEKTGGEATHKLTIDEMPSHSHTNLYTYNNSIIGTGNTPNTGVGTGIIQNGNYNQGSVHTGATGGGQAHNNLQPYITCYMWKKTA